MRIFIKAIAGLSSAFAIASSGETRNEKKPQETAWGLSLGGTKRD